jgi:cell division protein FtsI (penicillin-binding protein 3)
VAGNKKKEILVRVYLGFLFVCVLGVAIVGRAFYIQTVQGGYYRSMADSLTIFPRKVMAERGNIYSEDGRLLATTLPTFDIRIDFKTTYAHPDSFRMYVDSVAILLSAMFKDKSGPQYKNELVRERNNKSRYYLLKRNIPFEDLLKMREWPLFRDGAVISGMVAVQNNKRFTPFGSLAARTIGFVGDSGRVKVGLEGEYDEPLRGTQGEVMVQKISGGVTIPIDSREEIASQPGRDVFTTINVELQDVAEDALRRALLHHDADHGCVVLMEVKTGKIRAIANLGLTGDSSYNEILNYAVGEATEPGSTFKLATVASLMEDGLVNNNTPIEVGDGKYHLYNVLIEDHDKPETPVLTVKRAIEVSSNVAAAKMAYNNYASNPAKFYKHLEAFGFTKPIDIGLPGTASPVLKDPKKWSGVSAAFIAHGYEIQVTPMHTLMFYNAIANNGRMVKPFLVEKVKEYNRIIDTTGTTMVNEKICSDKTIKQLREILEGVVQEGTAMNLKTDYLQVAGKTGTAVIAQGNQGYHNRVYRASFCGYFPAQNPMYSMIVMVNSPSANGYYGNVVAGAIFKEVADKIYSLNMDIHAPVNQPLAESNLPVIQKATTADLKSIYNFLGAKLNDVNGEWSAATVQGNKVSLSARSIQDDVMPDVKGMSLKDALYMLESMGVKVKISGKGTVVKQSVPAGTKITPGISILIELT